LVAKRDSHKNHDEDNVKLLLAVPRYAEALLSDTDDSDEEGAERVSVVVRSRAGWRKQMAKWQEELREEEVNESGDGGEDKSNDDE
jgi:phage terminase small subunit